MGRLAEPAATNQACAAICIEDAVDADFLFYVLRNSYEQLRSLGRGGNQDNLNLSLVRDFRIPWPAVEIRQRFVVRCGFWVPVFRRPGTAGFRVVGPAVCFIRPVLLGRWPCACRSLRYGFGGR
ncbi:TPA: hypothetical protein NBJ31_002593, partial [Corynebacterium striatum]|nr:hypothetical protein [Corynebacterium striatum]